MPSVCPDIEGEPTIEQKGFNVICEAIVNADPKPEATWMKDEVAIKEGDQYKMAVGKGPKKGQHKVTCEILNFEKPLAGLYQVNLKNSSGEAVATFTVSAGDIPEMIGKPKIIQKEGGKNLGIKIVCKSKSEPRAEWFKDDKPVKENDRVKGSMSFDKPKQEYSFRLDITAPEKGDMGKYKCLVSNEDGCNNQTLNLGSE